MGEKNVSLENAMKHFEEFMTETKKALVKEFNLDETDLSKMAEFDLILSTHALHFLGQLGILGIRITEKGKKLLEENVE